jgi:hypothetical protein
MLAVDIRLELRYVYSAKGASPPIHNCATDRRFFL